MKTSTHATLKETLGHSRLSSLSHCGLIPAFGGGGSGNGVGELISTLKKKKKKKKRRPGMNRQTFPQSPRKRGKNHHTTIIYGDEFNFTISKLDRYEKTRKGSRLSNRPLAVSSNFI